MSIGNDTINDFGWPWEHVGNRMLELSDPLPCGRADKHGVGNQGTYECSLFGGSEIDLVKDNQFWDIPRPVNCLKNGMHRLNLPNGIRVCGINNVDDNVSLPHFFQSRTKSLDKLSGKTRDKTDGVGKRVRASVFSLSASNSRIQGRK